LLTNSQVVLSGEGADELFGGYNYLLPDYLRQDDPLTKKLFDIPLPTAAERGAALQALVSRPREQDHVSISDISLTDSQLGRAMMGGLITHRVIGITGPPQDFFSQATLSEYGTPDITRSIAEGFSPHVRRQVASGTWHSLHGALVNIFYLLRIADFNSRRLVCRPEDCAR
jgi:asparagine synthase (glutamine-hydrolysing)